MMIVKIITLRITNYYEYTNNRAGQVPRWTSAASPEGETFGFPTGQAAKSACPVPSRRDWYRGGLSNNSRWELLRSFEAACQAINGGLP